MKKILSLTLCCIMVLCAIPTVAFADKVQTGGKCGDNITWAYDTKTATLSITGTGDMYPYGHNTPYDTTTHSNSTKWYDLRNDIENVVISDGVTSIGEHCFENISAIKSVTLGKDIKAIGEYAFANLFGFENFIFPDSVESIGDWAFYNCGNLKEVTFGKGLKKIGKSAFDTCYSLEKVTFNSSIEEISDYAFNNCTALKNLSVPNSVKIIGKMALGYNYLWEVDPKFNHTKPLKGFVLTAEYGSAAQQYAYKNGVNYNDSNGCKEHNFDKKQIAVKKICTKQYGIYYKQCKNCNSRRFYFTTKSHTFKKGSERIVKKPTFFKNGYKTKYCTYCKKNIKIIIRKGVQFPAVDKKEYKNKVEFSLSKIQKGVTHYEIKIYRNGMKKPIRKIASVNSKIVFNKLSKNQEYEYTARAIAKKGKKTAKSLWVGGVFNTKKK